MCFKKLKILQCGVALSKSGKVMEILLKCFDRTLWKFGHSMRMCLTVITTLQLLQVGAGSLNSKWRCVYRVCPIRSRVRTTSSFRLDWEGQRAIQGLIACNLLDVCLSHECCHFILTDSITLFFASQYGNLTRR